MATIVQGQHSPFFTNETLPATDESVAAALLNAILSDASIPNALYLNSRTAFFTNVGNYHSAVGDIVTVNGKSELRHAMVVERGVENAFISDLKRHIISVSTGMTEVEQILGLDVSNFPTTEVRFQSDAGTFTRTYNLTGYNLFESVLPPTIDDFGFPTVAFPSIQAHNFFPVAQIKQNYAYTQDLADTDDLKQKTQVQTQRLALPLESITDGIKDSEDEDKIQDAFIHLAVNMNTTLQFELEQIWYFFGNQVPLDTGNVFASLSTNFVESYNPTSISGLNGRQFQPSLFRQRYTGGAYRLRNGTDYNIQYQYDEYVTGTYTDTDPVAVAAPIGFVKVFMSPAYKPQSTVGTNGSYVNPLVNALWVARKNENGTWNGHLYWGLQHIVYTSVNNLAGDPPGITNVESVFTTGYVDTFAVPITPRNYFPQVTVIRDFQFVTLPWASAYPMSNIDTDNLYRRAMALHLTLRIVVKKKWYQSGLFKTLLSVIAVVAAVFQLYAITTALLSAISVTSIFALVINLAEIYITNVLLTELFTLIVTELGVELAFVLAAVAAVAGITLKALKIGNVTAEVLMLSVSKTTEVTHNIVEEGFNELAEDTAEFERESKQLREDLKEFNDLLGIVDTDLTNAVLRSVTQLYQGSPSDYYNQTIHSGNIGVKSLDIPRNYVGMATSLPDVNAKIDTYI